MRLCGASLCCSGSPIRYSPAPGMEETPKSTLAIPEEEIGDLERPVGSLNTGTDCFAELVAHLARQPEWQDPFASFSTHRSQTSPLTQLVIALHSLNRQRYSHRFS